METIKKKLASLKDEKDSALERVEEVEQEKKEAEARAEAVGNTFSWILYILACVASMTAIMQEYSRGLCFLLLCYFFLSVFPHGYVLATMCLNDLPNRLCSLKSHLS